MPWRSRTTISSAFLFAARLAQALAKFSAVILRLPVKLAVANDFLDRRRNEITNGLPARNPVSDIARGNIEEPANDRIRMRGLQTAPVQDSKLNHLREIGETSPGRERRDVVLADQANEFGVRLARFQRFHRVHGVGWRRAFQFHCIQTKPWLPLDRGTQHFHANLGGRRRAPEFVGRDRGRDEDHALELQLLESIACQDEMRLMNRIERPAEYADLFQFDPFCSHALGALFVSRGEHQSYADVMKSAPLGQLILTGVPGY